MDAGEGRARSEELHGAHRAGAAEEAASRGSDYAKSARPLRAAIEKLVKSEPRHPTCEGRHHAGATRWPQHKAMRPTWEGHLRLSLVTCPVALYSATERSADIHFNLINPKTNNRIRMQTVDAGTGEPVERADLVKGFAVSKNKYVLFDKDELDAVRLESTRILDIEEFVDAADDRPHLLGRALLSRAVGQDRYRGLRGDPCRDGEAEEGGAGPRRHAPARTHLRAGAARQGHPAHDLAHPRRDPRDVEVFDRNLPKPDARCCRSPRRSSSSRTRSSIRRASRIATRMRCAS